MVAGHILKSFRDGQSQSRTQFRLQMNKRFRDHMSHTHNPQLNDHTRNQDCVSSCRSRLLTDRVPYVGLYLSLHFHCTLHAVAEFPRSLNPFADRGFLRLFCTRTCRQFWGVVSRFQGLSSRISWYWRCGYAQLYAGTPQLVYMTSGRNPCHLSVVFWRRKFIWRTCMVFLVWLEEKTNDGLNNYIHPTAGIPVSLYRLKFFLK